MKNNILKYLTSAALALAVTASVQAIQITGTIRMNGNVFLDTQSLATANNATSFGTVTVSSGPTGDFTSPAGTPPGTGPYDTSGQSVTWKPFGWNPSTAPVANLWTFTMGAIPTTYAFDLTTITSFSRVDATELLVLGTGTVHITGYDATPANWSFTVTDTSGGTSGSFSFGFADSNTAAGVPDGGMTVMLLGAVLSGLGLLRRKLA